MKTPDDLRAKLTQYPDQDSAATIYAEAKHIIKQYQAVADEAQEIALNAMPQGVTKVRTASGYSLGYTQPKSKRLNRGKWTIFLADNPDIASQVSEAEQFIDELKAPFMVLSDPRFYIR